jgi:patatin-like phospholipase/acyl hydrolase
MVELYTKHAGTIFRPGIRRLGALRPVHRTANQRKGLLAGLKDAGVENADKCTLGSLERHVLVTTFLLNGTVLPSGHHPPAWKAKLFHNFKTDNDGEPNPDLNQTVIDVILRSSAAPVLFGIYQGFADGGLVAINPVMCALAQAMNPATGGASFNDVRVLSIGTGKGATLSLNVTNANWGFVQWGLHAGRNADRFIDAFADVPEFQARQLLGNSYLRLNPEIPHDAGCDRPSDIPALIKAADDFKLTPEWATALKWVKEVWLPSGTL